MVVLCEMMKSIWAKWWYLVCVSLVCVCDKTRRSKPLGLICDLQGCRP